MTLKERRAQRSRIGFGLSCLNAPLKKSRLGELLVSQGKISRTDLQTVLGLQIATKKPLGTIFTDEGMISKGELRGTLVRQFVLRSAATVVIGAMSLGSLSGKRAMAGSIDDIPAKLSVSFNQGANAYGSMKSYPAVFGTSEKRSGNLKPFTKWSAMFDKFDRELRQNRSSSLVKDWQKALKRYDGMDLKTMSMKVNDLVNAKRYINDSRNYGKSDYWATPVEFLERGGDCEDFAIAKYVALRALGVPESRLRVAIVQDTLKNIPHAVLMVYTDKGTYVLDNQIKTLVNADRPGRYRPIYSINRTAWWMHTAPSTTRLASAR